MMTHGVARLGVGTQFLPHSVVESMHWDGTGLTGSRSLRNPAPKILSRRIDVPIRPVRLDLCLASGCALGDLGLLCRPHNPP